jgi:GTP cyclohydrolase I
MEVDRKQAARAIRAFLDALGIDVAHAPELSGTPERVVDAYERDFLAGYSVDVRALLADGASPIEPSLAAGPVLVDDIALSTMCPHHLLPAIGRARVAYLPGSQIVGIGTVARLVDAFARRLVLQEKIGNDVVTSLCEHAGARGAVCHLELLHSCLAARGARQPHARVVTIASAGDVDQLEALFLQRAHL